MAERDALIDAELTGEPFVVYRDGRDRQVIVRLDGNRLMIGRDPDMDVPLFWDHEISRVHAELQRAGTQWMLVDDGLSRNGSYVGDERIIGRRVLQDGDRLRFGSTELTFRAPAQARGDATRIPR